MWKCRPIPLALCLAFLSSPPISQGTAVTGAEPEIHLASAPCNLVAAPAGHFVIRVPFEVVDGRIYVEGRVNQRGPFRFAIDTGASGIGRADARLVRALGLTATGQANNSDGVQTEVANTVHLDSIELGGVTKIGGAVITRDYASRLPGQAAFDAIIARDFFADGLLILDYPNKTLSFSRTMTIPQSGHVLSYEKPFRVPVKIGNVQAQANLDTGANVTFVMPTALYHKVASGALAQAGVAQLTNSQIEIQRAVVPGPFKIGAATLSNVEVRVAQRFPELLVGAHVLQKFAVLIDQRSKRIALCKQD
jgi:predicted aspartyl protease